MDHLLLTGATGLLGRYLMKDLLKNGVKLAVLARPSRRTSPEARVEAAMRVWDNILGEQLPRPVVLKGDINSPDLGLSNTDIKWASENCSSMIHNAASLSFVSTGRDSEPWRSNVDGTATVLEFCQQAGIKEFFHVSTAYVAGLREGRILESELDVGQEFANPYEESKVMAEKLVREANFINDLTVFRPAIIVGDSQTGLTFTYHNFYAMVQLAYTIARSMHETHFSGKVDASNINVKSSGDERKNLVPVDWVSEVMATIVTDKTLHGKTYHLTPRLPVPSRLIRDVIEEVIGLYGLGLETDENQTSEPTEMEKVFFKHMEVYESYWKDDPEFDSTNTQTAVPQNLCPHVDRDMLTLMAKDAIARSFNWRDPKVNESEVALVPA
ncbi:Linear gramicidin synthase subunit D [Thalassoglobus neptunius]|uniref:Linear gramicidin synthase subunit D n=1 Tax=Thalassoglobus neptunius TaxID=1938619 RepID=A0A5C5X3Z0_9PLAN|nr:SDR family oxidoreductase [Thalassoglobus neptunius]TWT57518.1 Linear gramicidin synthase subunit D [Thalassoglobus neptunius]